jgi:hypothetical protein
MGARAKADDLGEQRASEMEMSSLLSKATSVLGATSASMPRNNSLATSTATPTLQTVGAIANSNGSSARANFLRRHAQRCGHAHSSLLRCSDMSYLRSRLRTQASSLRKSLTAAPDASVSFPLLLVCCWAVQCRCPLCDRAASCAQVCSRSASHGSFCATSMMHQ